MTKDIWAGGGGDARSTSTSRRGLHSEVGEEIALRRRERELARRVDWSDRDERNEARKERRLKERLASLPADRRCPVCGVTKLELSSWAGDRCVSCHRFTTNASTVDPSLLIEKDGVLVGLSVRLARGLVGAGLVAQLCGWSKTRQRTIEQRGTGDREETARLRLVLSRMKSTT